ncbi:MAG: gamma-glutamyl-phosphate reductase, partial [Nitrospinae bacterium CG11_big_fil_rev_8_21_14_0_20_56_8]
MMNVPVKTGQSVAEIAGQAKAAALLLARLPTEVKNRALARMAEALESGCASILKANREDLDFAQRENIPSPLVARLKLDESKVMGMAKGIRSVVKLEDPVGRIQSALELDRDLVLRRVTCPIGVIGAIFESRPDAVPQISSLCLKSGNAVILKGGREAQHSNRLLVSILVEGAGSVPGVPANVIQMIETRGEVEEMLKEEGNINLIIPRGSNAFVKYIQDHTRIPVLGHS